MNGIEPIQRGANETPPAAAQASAPRAKPSRAASEISSAPAAEAIQIQTAASDQDLKRDVERVSRELSDLTPHITFKVEEEDGTVVVRVLNPETKEVLRQIPPKELLEIRRRMDEYLGLLADEVA